MVEEKIIEKMGKTLNFEGCLFLQVNRIMRAMTIGDGSHTNAIEGLEGLLSAYMDEKYYNDLQNLADRVIEKKKELARTKGKSIERLNDNDLEALVFNITKVKFSLLMRLAARKRFLPETAIEDVI